MAAVLVRLKLSLLSRAFRRGGWSAFGMVIAYLFALGLVAPLLIGLGAVRGSVPEVAGALTVPGFAMLTFGWLLLPLVFFGVDETLDPGRFALLPVPARRLLPGLVLSSYIGAPGLALILLSIGYVVAWSGTGVGAFAALIAAPLGALTCVLISRALTTALAGSLATRRSKENMAAIVAFGSMFIGIGMQLLTRWLPQAVSTQDEASELARSTARLLGWTPFGWAWAVPLEATQGRWVSAGAHLALAAALAGGLWAWWGRGLAAGLTTPPAGVGGAERVRSGAFLGRLFGSSPRGAIAARVMRSVGRDSRAKMQLVMLAVIPVLMVAPSLIGSRSGQGEDTMAALLGAAPLVGFLAGMLMANSLVLDGTAVSLHALVGVPGRDDRWGRALAYLAMSAPVLLVILVTALAVTGRWDAAPALVGVTVAALLSATGAAAYASALFQWPAPPSDGNPFAQNSGGGAASFLLFLVNSLLAALGSLPAIVLAVMWFAGVGWAGLAALVVGPACGALCLWLGCRLGGDRLQARWPEALAAMARA